MKKISLILFLLTIGYTSLVAETLTIRVTDSTPIYDRITVREPYFYYKDVPVNRTYNCGYSEANKNSIGLDTIIGAGLGVILGNQIRKGSYNKCNETVYEKRQFKGYHYTDVNEITGYKNCGYIRHRKICKDQIENKIIFIWHIKL